MCEHTDKASANVDFSQDFFNILEEDFTGYSCTKEIRQKNPSQSVRLIAI